MGGMVIIVATLVGYFASHLFSAGSGPSADRRLLLLYLFTGMGVVGFLDDFIKIRKQRSLGPVGDRRSWSASSSSAISFAVLAPAVPGRARADAGVDAPVVRAGHPADQPGRDPVRASSRTWSISGDVQRGEPHRRAGRPGRRRLGDGVRRVHGDLVLPVPQRLRRPVAARRLLRGARPAGHRADRGLGDGGLLRLPVVERGAGADLHGRHRLAGARRRWSPASRSCPGPSCCWSCSAACSWSRRCR